MSQIVMRYVVLLLLLSYWSTARAQEYRGHVVDLVSRDSLINVHVLNVSRRTGTVTDADGYFRIAAQPNDSLRFSLIGYRSQTIRANRLLLTVTMVPDTVLLPGVRVLANRVTLYRDSAASPLRLPGVPYVENPKRVKPMTWTWGRKNFSGDAPLVPTVGPSASLAGPISYLMGYEKDQRKYERVQQEEEARRGYRQVVDAPQTRQRLMDTFQLSAQEYDSLLVIFNQQHLASADGVRAETVQSVLWQFFHDATRGQ